MAATVAPEKPSETLIDEETKVTLNRQDLCSVPFIEGLKKSGCAKTVAITDSMLVIDKMDTAFFSRLLTTENERFAGETANEGFQLIVKRTSYTSLAFNLTVRQRNTQHTYRGEAHLTPCFFLGAEMDEDENANSYSADEYHYQSPEGATLTFRVGDSEGVAIKTIVQSPQFNLALEQAPVLRLAR